MPYLLRAKVHDAAGIGPSDSVPEALFITYMLRTQRALAGRPMAETGSDEPFTDKSGNFHQGKLAALFRLPATAGEAEILAEMRRHHASFNPNAEVERTLARAMSMAEMHEKQIMFALELESIGGGGPLSFAAPGKKDARATVESLTALVADFRKQHPNLTFEQAWNLTVVPNLSTLTTVPPKNNVTDLQARQSHNESVTALNARVEAYRKEHHVDFETAFNAVTAGQPAPVAPKLTPLTSGLHDVVKITTLSGLKIHDAIAGGR
jgi:hypothetical protein